MPMAAIPRTLFRLGRNFLKYRLLTDTSIRSDRFGRAHMADLAARFVKNNEVVGSYLEFGVWRGSTFAQFYHTFRRHQLSLPMYAFDSFQGLPEPGAVDTLPGYEPFSAGQFGCSALVWIDCVLYESARATLEFIRPLLQDGTLIMFNDFYRFKGHPELGERRAFTEFRANYPEILVTDYAKFSSVGQTFLVHTL